MITLSLDECTQEMSIAVKLPDTCVYTGSTLFGAAYKCAGSGSEDKEQQLWKKPHTLDPSYTDCKDQICPYQIHRC